MICVRILCTLGLLTVLAGPATAGSSQLHDPARQAGVLDLASGVWLLAEDIDTLVPIASLTKIPAVLTFLTFRQNPEQLVTIQHEDWLHAGKTRLRPGDRVSVTTLLELTLISSDNCAARSLCRPLGLTREQFAYHMELLASSLGCRMSRFTEPSGLDAGNRSTVREIATLFLAALQEPQVRTIMGTGEFILETPRGDREMVHTSQFLRERGDVIAAKTGYTDAAGYCLVQCTADPNGDVLTVVLGCPSRSSRNRVSDRLVQAVDSLRDGF